MSANHPASPCSTCPYRKDAPLGHWARVEFEGLLAAERSQFGKVYACHGHAKVEPLDRGFCAGWLLDQRKRGIPSIALRMVLIRDEAARAALDTVTDGGAKLYRTIEAMCRANGVRP